MTLEINAERMHYSEVLKLNQPHQSRPLGGFTPRRTCPQRRTGQTIWALHPCTVCSCLKFAALPQPITTDLHYGSVLTRHTSIFEGLQNTQQLSRWLAHRWPSSRSTMQTSLSQVQTALRILLNSVGMTPFTSRRGHSLHRGCRHRSLMRICRCPQA